MKKSNLFMVIAFVFAIGAAVVSKANNRPLFNVQGYGGSGCTLQDLDQQNKNCAVQAGHACTISGSQAFNSALNCSGGTSGQLNYTN